MPKILILPDILVNKIAAGEIVERPASVVRELLDNSIDADARNISVEILHGGKKLIKVSDNGIGMDREDALLCFKRHTTSKIKTEDDLFNIHTLGFRGEALPSISAVSKVTLTTSPENADMGIRVEIGIKEEKTVTNAPPTHGTIIEVRDLFYNTPVRRKFLKSIPTELSHIIDIVVQKALPYYGIAFSLNHNGSDIINVHAVRSIKERFIQLYNEELLNEFFEIEREDRGLKLYGFLSTPQFLRKSKSYQYIFVNRRAIKNPTVSHAVYTGYSGLIKDGHPAFFLFLEIEPMKVDVNVHPAKREVRFETPEEIHKLIESAIYDVINTHHVKGADYTKVTEFIGSPTVLIEKGSGLFIHEPQPAFPTLESTPVVSTHLYIGDSFVVIPTGDGITIIDQHAAHERILYEKFLKRANIEAENLLLPIRIELPHKEFNIVIKYKDILHNLGLDIEDFGENNVIIRAVPKELRRAEMKGLLMDVASGIIESEESGAKGLSEKESLLRNISARLACHKSVRGKELLKDEELSRLIVELDKTDVPQYCPHGRPTKISFSIDDLKKMFKRK